MYNVLRTQRNLSLYKRQTSYAKETIKRAPVLYIFVYIKKNGKFFVKLIMFNLKKINTLYAIWD